MPTRQDSAIRRRAGGGEVSTDRECRRRVNVKLNRLRSTRGHVLSEPSISSPDVGNETARHPSPVGRVGGMAIDEPFLLKS
jgi:hypothetical protein